MKVTPLLLALSASIGISSCGTTAAERIPLYTAALTLTGHSEEAVALQALAPVIIKAEKAMKDSPAPVDTASGK